jgi:bisphosphoglycerate-dependent phosphoglycerate mutase
MVACQWPKAAHLRKGRENNFLNFCQIKNTISGKIIQFCFISKQSAIQSKLECCISKLAMHILMKVTTRSCIEVEQTMDDSSYRRNFDLDKKNENHYHSWKEHLKMSKIAKFGCEML